MKDLLQKVIDMMRRAGLPGTILMGALLFSLWLWMGLALPPPSGEFEDYQRWTAQEVDMFFDCSREYYQYESNQSSRVGLLRTEDGRTIEFWIGWNGGNWELWRVYPDGHDSQLFLGYLKNADAEQFTLVIWCDDPDLSLPKRITFTCEEITPEELYRPAWLGEKEEEPGG